MHAHTHMHAHTCTLTHMHTHTSTHTHAHMHTHTRRYGDMVPSTNWGKFVAGITMLCCMVTISLPISVIGGNFSSMWSDYRCV
jgi:hypothetical protein